MRFFVFVQSTHERERGNKNWCKRRWNPCVFQSNYTSVLHSLERYLALALRYQNKFANTKHCVNEMVKIHISAKEYQALGEAFSRAKDHVQLEAALVMARQPVFHVRFV